MLEIFFKYVNKRIRHRVKWKRKKSKIAIQSPGMCCIFGPAKGAASADSIIYSSFYIACFTHCIVGIAPLMLKKYLANPSLVQCIKHIKIFGVVAC